MFILMKNSYTKNQALCIDFFNVIVDNGSICMMLQPSLDKFFICYTWPQILVKSGDQRFKTLLVKESLYSD